MAGKFARPILVLLGVLVIALALAWVTLNRSQAKQRAANVHPVRHQAEILLAKRQELDKTIWAKEEMAQRYERRFIDLWDELRRTDRPYEVLARFPFDELVVGQAGESEPLELGIRRTRYGAAPARTITPDEWSSILERFKMRGYRIVQSEWHHSRFEPPEGDEPARSRVAMEIHAERPRPPNRVVIKGNLEVTWASGADPKAVPVPARIRATDVELLERRAEPGFDEIVYFKTPRANPHIMPLLVYDLNGDGLPEILCGGLNTVWRNLGGGKFEHTGLIETERPSFHAAVLADVTGDGRVDLVAIVESQRYPIVFESDGKGRFRKPGWRCADVSFEVPQAVTAGDIDADGDLDLFIANYKHLYTDGAMPTPFYDANDGYPASLLLNDGSGHFSDVTVEAGLEAKRWRRTYSSSFVDLDEDGDLDLLVVSDFSGADVHLNDGKGYFTDVTDRFVSDRHVFGMAHTFGDYDLDGDLDMYLLGMASTTAERMVRMGLGRDDNEVFKKNNAMRLTISYGNRMLMRSGDRYVQSPINDRVSRTGWSWGASSKDFDNDGDTDIYIGNGHLSGKSAADYCTVYWRHDFYDHDSAPDPIREELFTLSRKPLRSGAVSWNGFEHNVLLLNRGGKDFVNVAFLLGVAEEYDSRGVVGADVDLDGAVDLIVVAHHEDHDQVKILDRYAHSLHVYRNVLGPEGNWVGVRLGIEPGRSPVGAKVFVDTPRGPRKIAQIVNGDSFSSQHPTTVHFGLGAVDRVDAIEVRWLDGTEHRIESPSINQYHFVRPGT